MVRYAGWLTGRMLLRWGLAQHVDTVVSLVDELVANAVRHAAGPVTLRLVRGHGLHCEVGDSTGHLPVPRDESILGGPSWGLRLLGGCTRRWGTYRTATGKVVWFDYPLAA
jgi:sodium/proline symporter